MKESSFDRPKESTLVNKDRPPGKTPDQDRVRIEKPSDPLLIGPLPNVNKPLAQTANPLIPLDRSKYSKDLINGLPIHVGPFFDGPNPTK